jgi:hypothetical protein
VNFNWGKSVPGQYIGVGDTFSVAWQGFIASTSSETFTFQTDISGSDERLKLWIGDSWIVDCWSSLTSISPTGTVWMSSEQLTDVKLQYSSQATGAESQVRLKWNSISVPGPMPVPNNRLFTPDAHVNGSPFSLTVYPALR